MEGQSVVDLSKALLADDDSEEDEQTPQQPDLSISESVPPTTHIESQRLSQVSTVPPVQNISTVVSASVHRLPEGSAPPPTLKQSEVFHTSEKNVEIAESGSGQYRREHQPPPPQQQVPPNVPSHTSQQQPPLSQQQPPPPPESQQSLQQPPPSQSLVSPHAAPDSNGPSQQQRRAGAQQQAALVKELVRLLFMRTAEDPTKHANLKAMMEGMKVERQAGTLTNIPKELLRRASPIVGEDVLREALTEVKTRFKQNRSSNSNADSSTTSSGGNGGGNGGTQHGQARGQQQLDSRYDPRQQQQQQQQQEHQRLQQEYKQPGQGQARSSPGSSGMPPQQQPQPMSQEQQEQLAESSIQSREAGQALLDDTIRGGLKSGQAYRQGVQEATLVSAFDEDAEMTHLLQDNGDPFPGASDQHYGSKMSSSHGNSQGVAVALAADAPMAGSQAMAAPTATTSAMRPSPQASCLVRSRHECAAKLEQMTRGTGIGVACGSNESGGVVGDPAQMLADACQQYFRRVIGDVQRLARQRINMTSEQFGDRAEWGPIPEAPLLRERQEAEKQAAAREVEVEAKLREEIRAEEEEYNRLTKSVGRGAPATAASAVHWHARDDAKLVAGELNWAQVAWHFKKVRLCMAEELSPYLTNLAGGGNGSSSASGGGKRGRPDNSSDGQGDAKRARADNSSMVSTDGSAAPVEEGASSAGGTSWSLLGRASPDSYRNSAATSSSSAATSPSSSTSSEATQASLSGLTWRPISSTRQAICGRDVLQYLDGQRSAPFLCPDIQMRAHAKMKVPNGYCGSATVMPEYAPSSSGTNTAASSSTSLSPVTSSMGPR